MGLLSESQQDVLSFRDIRYPNAKRYVADDFSSVVYFYQKTEWFCAAGYKGLSKTISYAYKFPTEECRAEHVSQWQRKVRKQRKTNSDKVVL